MCVCVRARELCTVLGAAPLLCGWFIRSATLFLLFVSIFAFVKCLLLKMKKEKKTAKTAKTRKE